MNGEHTRADSDWAFGVHGVQALVGTAPECIRRLLVAEGRRSHAVDALLRRAQEANLRIERVPRSALDRRARNAAFAGNHQGIGVERQAFAPATEAELEARWPQWHEPLLVVLEGIEDPRNLGACLRTAEAAGVNAVLLPRRGTAPLSSTVAKAASGALEHLFIVQVGNLARRLNWLRERGVWVTGGVSDGDGASRTPHTEVAYTGATALVVGSEHRGLRRLTRECCDHLATIALAGQTASLNVSVALGVLLFEARRQRELQTHPEGQRA